MKTIGFIGVGNMGGALARAAAKGGCGLLLANRSPAKAEDLARETGGSVADGFTVALEADCIFLGVKPQQLEEALSGIAPALLGRGTPFVLVSMAAGTSIERLQGLAGMACPVIRIMPNIPVAVGEGMILYACSPQVSEEAERDFLDAMRAAGRFSRLEEGLIDAGSAVSGCGPAFAAMFAEALCDGGVACGLPRAAALELAAQMLLGSARQLLDGHMDPAALKNAVCSPAGTTIQGVRVLEGAAFRGAVIDAVIAAYEKNFKL